MVNKCQQKIDDLNEMIALESKCPSMKRPKASSTNSSQIPVSFRQRAMMAKRDKLTQSMQRYQQSMINMNMEINQERHGTYFPSSS